MIFYNLLFFDDAESRLGRVLFLSFDNAGRIVSTLFCSLISKNVHRCAVGFGDIGFDLALQLFLEDIAGEVFARPVVDVDESDAVGGGLHLVVFAVGGKIDVRALSDGFFGELGSRPSAECDALYGVVWGCRIADVFSPEAVSDPMEKIVVGDGGGERTDDAESVLRTGVGSHEDAIVLHAE